ncbi:MAG: hypothetical protein H6R46_1260, partial [Proteobacteria bacterium]|nr:hypothetical protein [Pseudomonadota bacterium]
MREQRQLEACQCGVETIAARVGRVHALRRGQPLHGAGTALRRALQRLNGVRTIRMHRSNPLEVLRMLARQTLRI